MAEFSLYVQFALVGVILLLGTLATSGMSGSDWHAYENSIAAAAAAATAPSPGTTAGGDGGSVAAAIQPHLVTAAFFASFALLTGSSIL
ncbi:hypothetical protein CDL15_Pgr018111 [Punica granatum]|uniref:Uncharacterized protein n=1 Tax=Punica granatum TaxID=22663 RepID=A0A218WHR6_PUNGR|nr:hypothetical protein CDL15_Pgr018111 [Punica granatum]PKI64381.1 hypothetical protein CRG98_015241 [Punica granatum]